MFTTTQRLCAVLAVACIALPACILFPPSQLSTAAAALLQHQHSMLQGLQDFPRHLSTLTHVQQQTAQAAEAVHTFIVENDRFMLDGQPIQLLSGSIHYHRIPSDQWVDRLAAVKAMGLNAIQLYVPWNFHQPSTPGPEGVLLFDGMRDLPGFISAAQQQGLMVLLRPGPYICAEWEFGGLPAWLLSVNSSMVLRSSDPAFLSAVDDWWGVLLPALAHLTIDKGGPIIMVQIENEYGYYGHDKMYLRHLAGLVRTHMGNGVVLYTVDGASLLPVIRGSLPGGEVLTTVDFGPTTDVEAAFELQRRFNPPGKSPPFCVEYYTGWLTHWGEPMANTSTQAIITTLSQILSTRGGTGNVNLYMAAGGTNFGPWAGANMFNTGPPQLTAAAAAAAVDGNTFGRNSASISSRFNSLLRQHLGSTAAADGRDSSSSSIMLPGPEVWRLRQAAMHIKHTQHKRQQQQQRGVFDSSSSSSAANLEIFSPHITSYDYHCPLGEAGTVGQVGVGGANKFLAIQQLLQQAQAQTPPAPADTAAAAGPEELTVSSSATAASPAAAATAGVGALPSVPLVSYGPVSLSEGLYLTDVLDPLSETCRGSSYASSSLSRQDTAATAAAATAAAAAATAAAATAATAAAAVTSTTEYPLPMEQYGQYYGLLVYSTVLGEEYDGGGLLGFKGHDVTWVYLDGQLLGHSFRSSPAVITVPFTPFGSSSSSSRGQGSLLSVSRRRLTAAAGSGSNGGRLLQLLVWPMGRNNFALAFGGQLADPKGLVGNVTLGGRVLQDWRVHHLCMEHGSNGSSSELPWRPLMQEMEADVATGAGISWGSGGKKKHQHKGSSSSSGSNDAQHRPFIRTAAEAQAQAVIAAAAEAATGSGAATAAARGVASIRAGWAAATPDSNNSSSSNGRSSSSSSSYQGRGALLLRGAFIVNPPAPTGSPPAAVVREPLPPTTPLTPTSISSSSSSSGVSTAAAAAASDRFASTFLHLPGGWGRGEVWVNGNSLGRYWASQGPQMSLYCPGAFLQQGVNEVLLLELDGRLPVGGVNRMLPRVETEAQPDFGGPPGGAEPL